ncbi:response regulator transcription factor [Chryseobacterium lathyri]|uniref:DNA-binding NarL/FixJ family response regulator n=1 Tax=Chryseobacterium lathyri TaxID=395933 RepID=A0ABT9SN42_9FLAO|nr:response regulator transcription factor [Chryseobacterium lathyri]MDP9960844.1 DNA-binding NarL/FixJ family response regulator [Chryseobacterium lathyri]MDQ0065651.1 DNA-binding NarL/FixJ family response regulator [Chryseobacterium lathyri]
MEKRILIADDHSVVRAGTALILRSAYPKLTIDSAENYGKVKEFLKTNHYDLLVLDIGMPGTKYTEMISELKNIQNDLKILIFSAYDQNIAIQYIRKGAEGYLNKSGTEDEIKNSIKIILETGYFYPPELIPFIIKNFDEGSNRKELSSREYQVFELLAKGNGNLEISNHLSLRINTISTFKKRIFQKLKINNIAELIELYKNLH